MHLFYKPYVKLYSLWNLILVKKIFEQRVKTIQEGKGIDWGTAEALAFSTLIQDGYNVRISG